MIPWKWTKKTKQPEQTSTNPKKPFTEYSPDYQTLLRAGPRAGPLREAHARIVVSGAHRSRAILTKLLTLACAAGAIGYARRLLISVEKPDEFLFNSLLKASSFNGFSAETLLFYRQMLGKRLSPSSYTLTSVIKSCAEIASVELGQRVHAHALLFGLGSDRFVLAGLITFYAKSGDLRSARKVFDKMPERTVVAWNAIISAYEQHGKPREAMEAFRRMEKARFEPDSATFVTLLSACSQLGTLGLGSWVHERILERKLEIDVVLGTSLINMYGRCGDADKAREVFDSMRFKNVMAWTAMVSGYGCQGRGDEALGLFRRMKTKLRFNNFAPKPNGVTLVAVLSACAHSGLVDEARELYQNMSREYGVVPVLEHHVCLVDALGRAGHIDEANDFLRKLDSRARDGSLGSKKPPTLAAAWTALLGACKMHKRHEIGTEIAGRLMALEPSNPGHHVALSNIHAVAGLTIRVEAVRDLMVHRQLKKEVGFSSVEIGRVPYLFRNADTARSNSVKIFRYVDELMGRCKEAGYVAVAEVAMHQVEEEERELALRYHSERLAIGLALMKANPEDKEPIRVMKNLRICEDCHLAVKYISLVSKREIIVRDRLRFHHFKDGCCSCNNFW